VAGLALATLPGPEAAAGQEASLPPCVSIQGFLLHQTNKKNPKNFPV